MTQDYQLEMIKTYEEKLQLCIPKPLLDDDSITDIAINNPDSIWYMKRGQWFKYDIQIASSEEYFSRWKDLFSSITPTGEELEIDLISDKNEERRRGSFAHKSTNQRFHVLLSPFVSTDEIVVSFRKPSKQPPQLISYSRGMSFGNYAERKKIKDQEDIDLVAEVLQAFEVNLEFLNDASLSHEPALKDAYELYVQRTRGDIFSLDQDTLRNLYQDSSFLEARSLVLRKLARMAIEKRSLSSIRKYIYFAHQSMSLLPVIERAFRQRRNIVIAGHTGSGKTTFMKSLIDTVPDHERHIVIEDTKEINLKRQANAVHIKLNESEKHRVITASDIVKDTLRMTPQRVTLTEIRGQEAYDLLNYANTGHGGIVTSMHAGSAEEAFDRLATMSLSHPDAGGNKEDLVKDFIDIIDLVVIFERKGIEVFVVDFYLKLLEQTDLKLGERLRYTEITKYVSDSSESH